MKKKTDLIVRTKKEAEEVFKIFCEKLLQKIDGPTMVMDKQGDIVFANDEYLYFFCFPKKDIIGNNWVGKIIPRTFKKDVNKTFSDIKRCKALAQFDSPALVVGDPENYIRWTVLPLDDGFSIRYLFIGRPIYYTKKACVRIHPISKRNLNQAYQDVIEILFAAHNAGEPGTAEHAYRVRFFSVALAKKMNFEKKKVDTLKVAALLHDIGKLAIDDKILFKKGKLNKTEFKEIKKHPLCGAGMVELIYFLRDIVPVMVNHHENFDGSGYPSGIQGEEIPLEARVLAVADIYEALTADRPYRKGFSRTQALEIMKKEKGIKLDPGVTDVFLRMVENGEIKEDRV